MTNIEKYLIEHYFAKDESRSNEEVCSFVRLAAIVTVDFKHRYWTVTPSTYGIWYGISKEKMKRIEELNKANWKYAKTIAKELSALENPWEERK